MSKLMLWLLLYTTAEQINSFQQLLVQNANSQQRLVCLLKGRAVYMMISMSVKLFITSTTVTQTTGTRVVEAAAMV